MNKLEQVERSIAMGTFNKTNGLEFLGKVTHAFVVDDLIEKMVIIVCEKATISVGVSETEDLVAMEVNIYENLQEPERYLERIDYNQVSICKFDVCTSEAYIVFDNGTSIYFEVKRKAELIGKFEYEKEYESISLEYSYQKEKLLRQFVYRRTL